MKYVSDDGKIYETIDECKAADEQYADELKRKELEVSEKKAAISKRKKELADAVSAADKEVDAASKAYDEAKATASEIIRKANKEADEVLRTALANVEKATEKRMNCIKDFTDEFGSYTFTYTGDKAIEEYNRVINKMKRIFNDSFSGLFWL